MTMVIRDSDSQNEEENIKPEQVRETQARNHTEDKGAES
jgi:hypothetical protein